MTWEGGYYYLNNPLLGEMGSFQLTGLSEVEELAHPLKRKNKKQKNRKNEREGGGQDMKGKRKDG